MKKEDNKTSELTREQVTLELLHRKTLRAVSSSGTCTYDPSINGGCAIGCLLTQEEFDVLDDHGFNNETAEDAFDYLPKRIQDLGLMFLNMLQCIHDTKYNWESEYPRDASKYPVVWTNNGIIEFKILIEEWDLDIDLNAQLSKATRSNRGRNKNNYNK